MQSEKDSGNISKDGMTGLKSKAYFLVSLENSIAKLALPNPSPNAGIVAVYLGNAPKDDLMIIATLLDRQTDYATHYKDKNADVIAGVYERSKDSLSELSANLYAIISERFPKLGCAIAHASLQKDSNAEIVLDEVAKNAYDSMLLQRPAP